MTSKAPTNSWSGIKSWGHQLSVGTASTLPGLDIIL